MAPGFPTPSWLACLAALALGLLVARRFVGPAAASDAEAADTGLAALLLALTVAVGVVPSLAFAVFAVGGPVVSWKTLTACALAGCALILLATRQLRARRLRDLPGVETLRAAWRGRRAVLLAAGGLAILYWLRYGGPLSTFTCSLDAAHIATGWSPRQDLLATNHGDARLGAVALISAAVAVFGDLRPLYAVLGAMLALSGWLIGRSGSRGAVGGWAGLLVLAANPWILSIPRVEENLLATTLSGVVLALALRRRPAWPAVGAVFGIAFSIRHPLVLAAPGLLLLARRDGRGAIPRLTSGALAFSALEHLHHLAAFGSVFAFESNPQFPPLPYKVLGLELRLHAFMNWPLYHTLVRTPMNPYPMLIHWWLLAADHLGLVVMALAIAGGLLVWRRGRARAALLWTWWLPIYLAVGVQEAWDHPNKTAVLCVLLPVAAAFVAEAAHRLVLRPALAVPVAVVVAALWVGARGLRGWSVPADPRYFEHYHLSRQEPSAWLRAGRARATDLHLWPDFAAAGRYGPLVHPEPTDVPPALEPTWGWNDDELLTPRPPAVFEIDLSRPLWPAGPRIRAVAGEPDLELGRPGMVVAETVVGWLRRPLRIHAAAGPRVAHLELTFTDYLRTGRPCDPRMMHCLCHRFDDYEYGASRSSCRARRDLGRLPTVFRLRVPGGRLGVVALLNPVGHVAQLWKVHAEGGRAVRQGPIHYWHD